MPFMNSSRSSFGAQGRKNTPWRAFSFSSHTFTNAGATGVNGPSLAQCRSAYASTTWANSFLNMTTNGIQRWTVPSTGNYRIVAVGAEGGRAYGQPGGYGARMAGTFSLVGGSVINILVGQAGEYISPLTNNSNGANSGGGGGTFVWKTDNTLLIAAGGGGGSSTGGFNNRQHGSSGTSGNAGTNSDHSNAGAAGGTNGSIGSTGAAGAGAGWNTGGLSSPPSQCGSYTVQNGAGPLSGGQGGLGGGGDNSSNNSNRGGGFGGGGGATGSCNTYGSGGGGGYSGGGTGNNCCQSAGGGGGSYNSGTNQVNESAINSNVHGYVTITRL